MKCIQSVMVVLFWAPLAAAQTSYSGTLSTDTVMSGECIIEANLTVPSGIILTILPGTTVGLRNGINIRIEGQLIADGTQAAPILFTRYANISGTRWKQIMFVSAADSRFDWCTFEYANSTGDHKDYYGEGSRSYHEAIVAIGTHLDFDHCTFQKLPSSSGGEGDAMAIISDDPDVPGTASANIRNCRFLSIGQGVHTRYSYVLVEGCTFDGKNGDNDYVDLYGESDPVPMVRYNAMINAHDDMINPTKCSAIILGNLIAGCDDHGVVLRDRCDPILINNLIYDCSNACIAIENSCNALLINNTLYKSNRGIRLFEMTDRVGTAPYYLTPGSGSATLINCIIWNCTTPLRLEDSDPKFNIPDRGAHVTVRYSDIKGGQAGASISGSQSTLTWQEGNIDLDPLFADPLNAALSLRDYHLQSQTGRWNPATLAWVTDAVTSPCIDAGDPASDWTAELWPNGGRINMGGFGGTPQASMSTNTAVGKPADIDQDGSVNLIDLARLAEVWMLDDRLTAANLDRTGSVDLADLALFADAWLN